jgi:hypothetical protein
MCDDDEQPRRGQRDALISSSPRGNGRLERWSSERLDPGTIDSSLCHQVFARLSSDRRESSDQSQPVSAHGPLAFTYHHDPSGS